MTATNRFLNRLFILLIGLALLVVGGALVAGAFLPDVQASVSDAAESASGPTADALSGGQTWILWVTAAAALVVALVLVWFVLRQGGGRTSTLVRVDSGARAGSSTRGTVTVDATVAERVLEDALAEEPGIAAVHVTAFEVRGTTVLRVTVDARRGASPVAIRSTVDSALQRWNALLGTDVPAVVQIVAGLRSRVGGDASRVA